MSDETKRLQVSKDKADAVMSFAAQEGLKQQAATDKIIEAGLKAIAKAKK